MDLMHILNKPCRPLRLSGSLSGRLKAEARRGLRETVYRHIEKQGMGKVVCGKCGLHVALADAALHSVKQVSRDAPIDLEDYCIRHRSCN